MYFFYYNLIFLVIFLINIYFSFFIICFEKKSSKQMWIWILTINFIPFFGLIFYLYFGCSVFLKKRNNKNIKNKLFLYQKKDLYLNFKKFENIYISFNNYIKVFFDGEKKFKNLINDIKNSKHHIFMEYYIYRDDKLGIKIKNELIKALYRNVEVRILLDAWGSYSIKKNFFNDFKKNGGKIKYFSPLFMPYLNFNINYRNHKKIVIIDGKIGYIGGFNVGNEYIGKSLKFGYWRDNHLKIEGDIVFGLQKQFLKDWGFNKIDYFNNKQYFPINNIKNLNFLQMITSGPNYEFEQIKITYLKMIYMAKKEIFIQTPYYIPDDSIHDALKTVLLFGINVTIQIPSISDHFLVYWATYSFISELLNFGANIMMYKNGFIHSKTIIIDEKILSIGTANLDIRSLKLDFEVNIIIYDIKIIKKVKKQIKFDILLSEQLTKKKYCNRNLIIKIKEGFARLISPLL